MPRGSNNRVDEQNTNRNNNNRMFDSQNNNKGGYSVGVDEDDYTDGDTRVPPRGPMRNGDPAQGITMHTSVVVMETGDNAGNGRRRLQPDATSRASDAIADQTSVLTLGGATDTERGYNEPPMELELGTVLPVEWTSQHACGPNDKTSCEIVMQYGCAAAYLGHNERPVAPPRVRTLV